MTSPASYRADVDGLRAVAVLAVVAHHVAPNAVRSGFVGVDIFFVISGYLITRIVHGERLAGRFSYGDFYARRCRRILPALVLVLSATWFLGAALLTGPEFLSLGKHIAAAGLFASNILLYGEVGYFDSEAGAKPLLHLWSLGVEEQFYLLWPAIVLLATRRNRSGLGMLSTLGLLSLLVSVWASLANATFAFFLLPARLWELLAGGFVAIAARDPGLHDAVRRLGPRTVRTLREACAWTGVALLVAAFALIDASRPYPSAWATLPVLGAAAFIAAGPDALVNRVVLGHRWAAAVGLISYPLYLWHWPLISLVEIVSADVGLSDGVLLWARLACALLAIVLAWITFQYVERPLRYRAAARPRLESRRDRPLLRLVVPLFVMVAVGGGTAVLHGIPARYAGPVARDEVTILKESSRRFAMSQHPSAVRCHQELDAPRPDQCLRSLDAPTRVVLLGDSHAESLFPGLAGALPGVSVQLISHTRCPPLTGIERRTDFTRADCSAAMNAVVQQVAAAHTVQTVVLVSRGPLYVTSGTDYRRRDAKRKNGQRIDGAYGADAERSSLFRDGLRHTSAQLRAAGKHVILVHDVPELQFLPRDCVVGRPFGIRAPVTPCSMERSDVDARNAAYRRILLAVADDVPGTRIFDSIPIFCDARICPVMDPDGRLRYADDNHVSLRGSQMLGVSLAAAVQATLPP